MQKKGATIYRNPFLSYMVPVGGLEPPRPKATDFESVVYTNFTTPALLSGKSYTVACSKTGGDYSNA